VPVLIFLLALLRLVDSRSLLAQSRYAILGIVILAALVTPTPDIFNLMLVVIPMCALFYVGVLGAYLLERHRDRRKLPWRAAVPWTAALLALAAAAYVAITRFGLRLRPQWRFFTRENHRF
jgi:sec-independent protein translocase protein TatC